MSWIKCKCGEILHDNTDNISYKGYLISDKQFFPLLDLADEMIEATADSREELSMRFRENIGEYIRFLDVFQCYNCGRILIEGEGRNFYVFKPEGHENTKLLDVETGQKK